MTFLEGLSNYNLSICNETFIKKSAKTEKEWYRLFLQCKKQSLFSNHKYIKTPKVYEINHTLLYFTMKYEKTSYNFLEYLSNENLNSFYFIDILKNYINKCITQSNHLNVLNIFKKKAYDTIEKCNNKSKKFNAVSCHFINYINTFDNIYIPIGYCHGDLSLSNILVDHNEKDIIFIDFLDNFLDTILQDMVKLRQDTQFHLILSINKFSNNTIIKKLNELDSILDTFFKQYDFYNKYYKLFQILNIFRIIPYSKNQEFDELLLQICNIFLL